jgi:hypothetical protein
MEVTTKFLNLLTYNWYLFIYAPENALSKWALNRKDTECCRKARKSDLVPFLISNDSFSNLSLTVS